MGREPTDYHHPADEETNVQNSALLVQQAHLQCGYQMHVHMTPSLSITCRRRQKEQWVQW